MVAGLADRLALGVTEFIAPSAVRNPIGAPMPFVHSDIADHPSGCVFESTMDTVSIHGRATSALPDEPECDQQGDRAGRQQTKQYLAILQVHYGLPCS